MSSPRAASSTGPPRPPRARTRRPPGRRPRRPGPTAVLVLPWQRRYLEISAGGFTWTTADLGEATTRPSPVELSWEVALPEDEPLSLDRAIGIGNIYEELSKAIQEVKDDRVLHYSGGIGLGWGISGGEIAGINARCIAV